jgi:type IV pilus assembly protein PilB
MNQPMIADEVIQLVPESVARENSVIPYKDEDDALHVLISDPFDLETIEKLRFILNRKVETALAPRSAIQEAINRYYGQVEGESADSILQEFTDTQIDFTETRRRWSTPMRGSTNRALPVVRLVGMMIQEAVQLASLRHPRRAV